MASELDDLLDELERLLAVAEPMPQGGLALNGAIQPELAEER